MATVAATDAVGLRALEEHDDAGAIVTLARRHGDGGHHLPAGSAGFLEGVKPG
jgi:hypothetical protein